MKKKKKAPKKKTTKKKTVVARKPVGSVLITSGGPPYRLAEQRMDEKITYLPPSEYRYLIKMLEEFSYDTDNDGQIIIYTDHVFDENDRVVAMDYLSHEEEECEEEE